MNIVCLDLEGVLVPEIWIAFAKETGIPELEKTTRDEPDYDKLMNYRINILKEHGLGLKEIQETIAKIDPMPGAKEFLDELFNGIRNIENNWVIGDLYWDPVMINHEGVGWAMIRGAAEDGSQDMALNNVVSNTTLFDFEGKALPALKSFKDTSEGSTEVKS